MRRERVLNNVITNIADSKRFIYTSELLVLLVVFGRGAVGVFLVAAVIFAASLSADSLAAANFD